MITQEDIDAFKPKDNTIDIEVESIVEEEDGGATYTFIMNSYTEKTVVELGLKLLLYCGAAGISTNKVFDSIMAELRASKEEEEKPKE